MKRDGRIRIERVKKHIYKAADELFALEHWEECGMNDKQKRFIATAENLCWTIANDYLKTVERLDHGKN